MKLIYKETIRVDYQSPFRTVTVFYPDFFSESQLPAEICLETGRYAHEIESAEWSLVLPEKGKPLTEAQAIRKAQKILEGTFEERACEYCDQLGWKRPA